MSVSRWHVLMAISASVKYTLLCMNMTPVNYWVFKVVKLERQGELKMHMLRQSQRVVEQPSLMEVLSELDYLP